MKNVLFLAGILFFAACKQRTNTTATTANEAVVVTAEDNKSVIDTEINIWQAAKTRKFDVMNQLLADDYTAFFGKNTLNKTDAIRSFEASTVNDYRMSNIRTKGISKDVIVVYYNLQQDIVSNDGSKWIPNVAASSIYTRRNGVWKNAFYHETPMD